MGEEQKSGGDQQHSSSVQSLASQGQGTLASFGSLGQSLILIIT